jgi:hypothetical protein
MSSARMSMPPPPPPPTATSGSSNNNVEYHVIRDNAGSDTIRDSFELPRPELVQVINGGDEGPVLTTPAAANCAIIPIIEDLNRKYTYDDGPSDISDLLSTVNKTPNGFIDQFVSDLIVRLADSQLAVGEVHRALQTFSSR